MREGLGEGETTVLYPFYNCSSVRAEKTVLDSRSRIKYGTSFAGMTFKVSNHSFSHQTNELFIGKT